MAYDIARRRVLLFGGVSETSPQLDETWEWDGTTWTRITPALSPPARDRPEMAYNPARRRIILFGGVGAFAEYLDDTWEWDGTSWTQLAVSTPAPERGHHMMAYDSAHARIQIVGGYSTSLVRPPDWQLQYISTAPDENCRGADDADRDGLSGCADPDCWALCTPSCPPPTPCDPDAPRCGDGSCNPFLETSDNCPEDCA